MDDERRCETCMWLLKVNSAYAWNACRRYPPARSARTGRGLWPPVERDDYCGEWQMHAEEGE